MTGKISDAEKNFKTGNKLNSNMVKISSSKSILSYQNGSALNAENGLSTTDDGLQEETVAEDPAEDPFEETQNPKNECLDLLRKKLISDLSLTVFSCDLENKLTKMEPIEISKERQSVIQKLVVQISQLSDAEKLLLYLKLPSSTSSPFDPLRQPLNPLGNRQEIQQTIVWIKTHLEEDSEISIPKQDVYDQYLKYCENVSMKPLSTADFGKVMKQVYPGVRPRRLGTRGNSRYCYSGMRNTCKLPTPILPRSTTENYIAKGCAVSSFLSAEGSKCKKLDKSKRKWPSSICRGDKVTGNNRSASEKPSSACHVKAGKRSKLLRECTNPKEAEETTGNALNDVNLDDGKSEEVNLSDIKSDDLEDMKCEDCSDNSFSAFDLDCELRNDFGAYLKKLGGPDGEEGASHSTGIGHGASGCSIREKENDLRKVSIDCRKGEHNSVMGNKAPTKKTEESGTISSVKGDHTISSNISNGLDRNKSTVSEKQKPTKTKAKKAGASLQTTKNFKKSTYVPIQPKPTERLAQEVRFDGNSIAERKKESEGIGLCEESDSQEPEEEIVRYFKHLDETEMKRNGLVDEAVKNMERGTVQIGDLSQIRNPAEYGGTINQANQQLYRSQSCFEEHGRDFGREEKRDSPYIEIQRSQSSVELPTSTEPAAAAAAHRDATDLESTLQDDRKNKISHLRILLEMSVSSSEKNSYSNMQKADSSVGNALVSNGGQSSMADSVGHADSNYLLSNLKAVERDALKLNGLKMSNKGPSLVPQSPNTRTKYFSFTPISPGPQSPLKTSSASPFVSPRDTPMSRSRQNSHTDHFLSPSDRKSNQVQVPSDGAKLDTMRDNFFNFSKNSAGKVASKMAANQAFASGSRPRSYSSINFYRSKARRISSKPSGFDREIGSVGKNQIESMAQTAFPLTPSAGLAVQPVVQTFPPGESLSNEVQKFLEENGSKVADGQVGAMIRSRSAPLNRMMRETTWLPQAQVPAVYPGYFDSGNPNEAGKLSEEVLTNTGSTSEDGGNLSGFVANGDMANLTGEIFPGDPGIVDVHHPYFPGDFQRQSENSFPDSQAFSEDSTFSNKLNLNSSGTFDSAFASDSDTGMTENIKSYLPDFEGLDNKSLVETAGSGEEVIHNDRKLFKTTLYEGGNDNVKDPVITSFKPVLLNEMSSSPGSPVLNFFGGKINEDSQQLIEFFDFVD